ncbi:MAG: tetratricopeptide repeat protein [Candidatus Latescibacteria bacterium]|nr:tetratricopeptide repeat protein [Candidatus Latescibacterota bacterium]
MVVIAQDIQGAEVARPWVEQAGGTYRALLDQHNVVGKAYGLKYVPVAILLDEAGRLVRPVASCNIDDEEFRRQLQDWAVSGQVPQAWMEAEDPGAAAILNEDEAEADARFQLALVLLQRGKREEALAQLRQAVRLDPQNWLIRKQMWAIEAPQAFYEGAVDYGWQKAQMEREKEELLGGS